MATPVKRKAEMKAGLSPKFSMPIASAPRMTVKLSHDRKVRSLAKKTLGSTRVGRAMRLPMIGGKMLVSSAKQHGRMETGEEPTWGGLEERLA